MASQRSIAARSSPPLAAAAHTSLTPCYPGVASHRSLAVRRCPVGAGVGRPGDRRHLLPGSQPCCECGAHRRPSRPIARTHRTRLLAEASADGSYAALHHSDDGGSLVAGAAVFIVSLGPLASDIFAQLDRYGVVTAAASSPRTPKVALARPTGAQSFRVRPVSPRILRRRPGCGSVRLDWGRGSTAQSSARTGWLMPSSRCM